MSELTSDQTIAFLEGKTIATAKQIEEGYALFFTDGTSCEINACQGMGCAWLSVTPLVNYPDPY